MWQRAVLDIETITANGLCAGCGLCAGIGDATNPSIAMRDTPQGYRRPVRLRPDTPEEARLIDAVCPGANIRHDRAKLTAEYHPVWGPIIEARLGWSSDPDLRRNASSGGGLSAILTHLLATGAIDYVVQTAVSPESPVRNALTISTGRDDVFHAAGSRYAPSSPLEDIAARLEAPGRFAFVGKPCDVAGLRQLARHDPRVDAKVPYMLAFMCAGVPSYRGTSALLKAMGVEDESAVTAFRFRGDGWPGFATAELADGRKFTMDYDTSWGTILNRHLQFRCKICPDGIGEFADIVCADGWHVDDAGRPLFDESDGRSLVLTRTPKGEALLGEAMAAGTIVTEPVPIAAIHHMQPFQARRKGMVLSRLAAMALTGKRRPRFAGLELGGNTRKLGLKENLKSLGGTLRRLAGTKVLD
jgi:coenzyme F420 hydrogenase subunit beta